MTDALPEGTVYRTNPHTGLRYAVLPVSTIPYTNDGECDQCDGYGRIWNNADPTSGQFHECDCGGAA